MFLLLHITCSCIFMHTSFTFYIFYIFELFWDFSECFFLPPSLSSNASWHLNINMLRLGTLFVPGHPLRLILLLLLGSMMSKLERTSQRTFPYEAFIWNAKSSCRTSPTLTYPLSFIVGVGSHCVTSRSLVHPCWSKSFTPTCMDSIFQYLFFLLTFKVRTL